MRYLPHFWEADALHWNKCNIGQSNLVNLQEIINFVICLHKATYFEQITDGIGRAVDGAQKIIDTVYYVNRTGRLLDSLDQKPTVNNLKRTIATRFTSASWT